ncbi:MAG: malate:quinone oxidoreductase, partial [Chitinophagaceae bacterium]
FWTVKVEDMKTGDRQKLKARFVFIGAGGGALELLDKSDIPEGKGYGGFPVSGQWLVCRNPDIVARHYAKVYGTAGIGAPPMSVPHLDARRIGEERALFFGPFAGFSTKFLKHGSYLDLPSSITFDNVLPMISAGIKNLPLTKYLIDQIRLTPEQRLESLQEYYPNAKLEDWNLEVAGQRVQVIKDDPEEGGVLEFGTEVISSSDGSLAALLGASPGASTAVSIMLDVLHRCFPAQVASPEWQRKLREMIPSYGQKLSENEELCQKVRSWTSGVLGLQNV